MPVLLLRQAATAYRGSAMSTGTAWEALTGDPRRFLTSAWPWRATAYLLVSPVVAFAWWATSIVLLFVPAAVFLVLLSGVWLGAIERGRLRLLDPLPAPSAHARLVRSGLWTWLTVRLRDAATWKELGYALLFGFVLAWVDFAVSALLFCALYLLGFPILLELVPQYQPDIALQAFGIGAWPWSLAVSVVGLLAVPVVLYVITSYAAMRATLTRNLLVRWPGGDADVVELTRSRARLVASFDAQRRRIERDLHDGAQQRLTGLIMTLGLVKFELTERSQVSVLVDKAYDDAKAALTELRDLVRGIYPPVLTERGLGPALEELAERCPVPVDVVVHLPRRPPEAVEAALWFVANEALANVAKHSRADNAWLRVGVEASVLGLEIGDDGVGGADPAGSGLNGLADRIAVLDGRMVISSPTGGPTVVRVELPCTW
jgi:signal transduction histidine kinase